MKYVALTFGIFGFIFWHLAKEMLQIRPTGWYVGHINQYGDLVFHLGLINKFLESNKLLISSPIFAGDKPNYPIFADFVTSQVARVTGIDFALFSVTFLIGILCIYIARSFIKNYIRNERVVFVTLTLFFLNGGLGFYYFFRDYLSSQTSFTRFLLAMPNQYTDIKDKGYWWINTYLAYFLPQRGFLFAFPITLVVMSLMYFAFKRRKLNFIILAGLLTGVLPIVQAHSLFVIFLISIPFSVATIISAKNKKEIIAFWTIFTVVAVVIAVPSLNAISSGDFFKSIRFAPGWTSKENIFWFWLKNLGLFAPVLILSLTWLYKKNKYLFSLYLPFLGIFIISNLFVFQPWEFDNSKLLVYWYFSSSIVVAYFLEDQFFQENFAKKITGAVLLFLMIFAGSLDIFRTFTPITSYQIFNNKDLEVATAIKNLTPKEAIFVNASNHNNPIPALSGRTSLLGYHGWVWSHGIDFSQRETDIKTIYLGGSEAEQLIAKYKVSYIAISPQEKREFNISQDYFEKYPKINLGGDWNIYDVNNLWSDSNRQN